MRLTLAALILALTTSTASAETITGRASIIDADTLEIRGERIRILDIDAPEPNQPCARTDEDLPQGIWRCGQQAALALADWIGTRTVTCEADKHDGYGRWLAHCSVGGEDVATWLAENGWTVPYRRCKCEVIREASAHAKAEKRGIWNSVFSNPWEWRASKKKP
jgi:endonuclease YncB( thermonuclease family)